MKCNCLLRVVTRTEVARSGSGDKKKVLLSATNSPQTEYADVALRRSEIS